MDEENIKYIPEADHQHLQSQEREQEFVEEENFMADIDKCDQICQDLLTRIPERLQKSENKFDQICQDVLTHMHERLQKIEKILKDIRTPMQERLQKSEGNFNQIFPDFLTQELEIMQMMEEKFHGPWAHMEERLKKNEKKDQDLWTREQEIIKKREKHFPLTPEDFRTPEEERIQEKEKILEDIRTPMQERLQKSKDQTTTTTKSRHSTITSLLLGPAFFASRICSVGADFIPVKSDLSICKTDLSKLTDTCDHDEVKAIHCVLNHDGELGIGCFSKIWVKQGYCPFFRTSFGVLDIRPCLGNSSICPRDQYISNEVYKYPGCLINNSTRVLDILATQTTQSTTVRSSDAGDEESMLLILVVILGLITLSLLLIHGLRFLRSMKITSRGLRSAYARASKGHQDPQRDGLPDDGVDV